MGFFNRKPKVSIGEFCRNFYDTYIFNAHVGGVDLTSTCFEVDYNSILEADKSFNSVDFNKFQEEMTALRMELFGLAWHEKFKSERYTIPQSFFTRAYLQEIGKTQIWDIMGEYNQKIAMSATMTEDGKQIADVGGRAGRAKTVGVNVSRADMFDRWVDANIKDKTNLTEDARANLFCVSRAANRIGADIKRFDCVGIKSLAARLADRLGCDINLSSEALFRLSALIFGLYEGAKEGIEDVNIQM